MTTTQQAEPEWTLDGGRLYKGNIYVGLIATSARGVLLAALNAKPSTTAEGEPECPFCGSAIKQHFAHFDLGECEKCRITLPMDRWRNAKPDADKARLDALQAIGFANFNPNSGMWDVIGPGKTSRAPTLRAAIDEAIFHEANNEKGPVNQRCPQSTSDLPAPVAVATTETTISAASQTTSGSNAAATGPTPAPAATPEQRYRMLEVGEKIQEGDEVLRDGAWKSVMMMTGLICPKDEGSFRRPIPSPEPASMEEEASKCVSALFPPHLEWLKKAVTNAVLSLLRRVTEPLREENNRLKDEIVHKLIFKGPVREAIEKDLAASRAECERLTRDYRESIAKSDEGKNVLAGTIRELRAEIERLKLALHEAQANAPHLQVIGLREAKEQQRAEEQP